ncbi:MAG: putative peptide modification system cyclase [Arenimonas sp.]
MATNPHLPPKSTDKPTVSSVLRTVLLCDWADSTHLIETLGDARAVGLLQKHDHYIREALSVTQGRLIDKSDGILALFERPIQALDFALRYQQQMRAWGAEYQQAIQARIGIHVGDVMTWENAPDQVAAGAKPLEVEGFAKPVAARLMGLALPGQILLSGMAQSLAQRAQLELGERGQKLRWILHGRYTFKGVPAPMLVHEVGDADFSPLRAPPSTQKAWREIPLWRRPPVLALEILLTTGLIGGFIWSTLQSPPAIAFYERDWIVMGDLQNLTREKMFDDSLDTALRIGLEQSAYVNVISDNQEQDALKRMQREGQRIDRQTGAELALREGAKALVLPTLTEVGGHLRVTAEVIDPNTGVTVYTESAEAADSSKVLSALDEVLEKLRVRLGESVALVDKSRPLEEVTTPSIEALRAFSLAIDARLAGKNAEALALLEQAVKFDPDFAMAYLRMGFIMYSDNKNEPARAYLAQAQSKRLHLSNRESLLLDAAQAVFENPREMLQKWKVLASIYPDEYRAYYNYAYFAHNDAQQYRAARDFLGTALTIRNPARDSAYYRLGVSNLALGKYHEAIEAFRQSDSMGSSGYKRDYADAYAAQRQFNSADKILATQVPDILSGVVLEESMPEITYPIDQGNWSKAFSALDKLVPKVQQESPLVGWTYDGLRLSLRSYSPDASFAEDLRAYVARQQSLLANSDPIARRHLVFEILAGGWMAANSGDVKTASAALVSVDSFALSGGYPANSDMRLIVQAELDLHANQPKAAIEKLLPRSNRGDELYFLHVVLMRAYATNRNYEKAKVQADWLAEHRGLAYAEFNSLSMWQSVNVAESNMALLAAAHYAGKSGHADESASRLKAFKAAWPEGDRLMQVSRRLRELN